MSFELNGPEVAPKSGKAKQLVIFLHGVGADGNDLISLAPLMQDALPDAHFCSPDAPFECDMAPFGKQWFSLQERTPEMMLAGIETVAPYVNTFIDTKLAELGLTIDKLAIVGFSQGTMTALHVLPRRAQPCACIVGFSGAMVASQKLEQEISSKPDICLIHGEADPVVPFAQMANAEAALLKSGVKVEAHARPGLAHGIDEIGLKTATEFLSKQFASVGA